MTAEKRGKGAVKNVRLTFRNRRVIEAVDKISPVFRGVFVETAILRFIDSDEGKRLLEAVESCQPDRSGHERREVAAEAPRPKDPSVLKKLMGDFGDEDF